MPGALRYNYKKIKVFWLIPKDFVGRRRENSQCRMTDVGVWGRSLQRLGFLQLFNENNTILGIFRLKFLLKNIFLISLFYLRYT